LDWAKTVAATSTFWTKFQVGHLNILKMGFCNQKLNVADLVRTLQLGLARFQKV